MGSRELIRKSIHNGERVTRFDVTLSLLNNRMMVISRKFRIEKISKEWTDRYMRIYSLLYLLNKNHFKNKNLAIKVLPERLVTLLFIVYLLMQLSFTVISSGILSHFLLVKQLNLNVLIIIQIISMFLITTLAINQPLLSNGKLKSLDFLLGQLFTEKQKRKNLLWLAAYYSSGAFFYFLIINTTSFTFFYARINFFQLSILIISPIVTALIVFFSIKINIFNNKKFSVLNYLKCLLIILLIVLYPRINVEVKTLDFTRLFAFSNSSYFFFYLSVVFALFTTNILLVKLFKNKRTERLLFKGVYKDYFKEILADSLVVILLICLGLRIIRLSEISKSLSLVLVTYIFLVPNLGNHLIFNYVKLIGSVKIFSMKYSVLIATYTLPVLLFLSVLIGISWHLILIELVLYLVLLIIRHFVFLAVTQTGMTDSNKMDWFLFLTFFIWVTLFISIGLLR